MKMKHVLALAELVALPAAVQAGSDRPLMSFQPPFLLARRKVALRKGCVKLTVS